MNKKPLTKVAKIIAGQSPPSTTYNHTGDGLPFFQGKADFQERSPRVRMWCNSERRKEALPGDVLISVRAPVGAVNLCDQTSIIGRGLSAIRPTDELHGEYLFHFLRCHERQIASLGTGSTFQAITQDTLGKIEIPLPPLDDQKRIAHLLSKVEGLIAQRKEHLQQLDDLLKSVFFTMFGDPVRNEKGWDTKPLNEIAFVQRGKFTPRPRNDPKYYDGPFPFIQTGDIARSRGRLREYTQTLNELGTSVSRKFEIGTIVIAIVGATIGETAILEISTYATDSVIGITLKNSVFETEPVFLEFVLRHWKEPLRAKAPEAARANINIETLTPLPIISPPSPMKLEFCELAARIHVVKRCYQDSISDLESLFEVASQKAFKDELNLSRVVLPETNDEIDEDVDSLQEAEEITDEAAIELPTPDDVRQLGNADGRNRILNQWLHAYTKQLATCPFSATAFTDLAQQKLSELQADDEGHDYGYELGAADYDNVKNWIFENLQGNRLKQDYDDANNRVRITPAKD